MDLNWGLMTAVEKANRMADLWVDWTVGQTDVQRAALMADSLVAQMADKMVVVMAQQLAETMAH